MEDVPHGPAEAYDSVDRMLLWDVLAGSGPIIKVIGMFMCHDGGRAGVQLPDDGSSAWFPREP